MIITFNFDKPNPYSSNTVFRRLPPEFVAAQVDSFISMLPGPPPTEVVTEFTYMPTCMPSAPLPYWLKAYQKTIGTLDVPEVLAELAPYFSLPRLFAYLQRKGKVKEAFHDSCCGICAVFVRHSAFGSVQALPLSLIYRHLTYSKDHVDAALTRLVALKLLRAEEQGIASTPLLWAQGVDPAYQTSVQEAIASQPAHEPHLFPYSKLSYKALCFHSIELLRDSDIKPATIWAEKTLTTLLSFTPKASS
ncbi:hypothetical protein F9L16_23270 [Agarivorans sp. B2Z047]|nr:hypothetical protein [Agarivorans sp. B2Z047]MPW31880.1 hypothetical protein [Agarivorans sp. B2Z047]